MRDLGYIKPEGNISDIVDKWLTYKRVVGATNPGDHGNHSKLIIVDDSVCYVGSDNAYPSYNEEFGVWLDNDARAISSFVSDYWKGLWNFARPG
jgi:phosphatidylserine/phosphatidylglycerophosphate/cardiolipin synthase-like enzyme